MKTTYTVFHPNGTVGHGDVDWPEEPGYDRIRALVEPIIGGHLEHVTVLHNDARADMFVHETGVIDGMPRNEAATAIYRHNWLSRHPKDHPESLPYIAGVAVLFDRRIWF